jgi:hypothetical protein
MVYRLVYPHTITASSSLARPLVPFSAQLPADLCLKPLNEGLHSIGMFSSELPAALSLILKPLKMLQIELERNRVDRPYNAGVADPLDHR